MVIEQKDGIMYLWKIVRCKFFIIPIKKKVLAWQGKADYCRKVTKNVGDCIDIIKDHAIIAVYSYRFGGVVEYKS